MRSSRYLVGSLNKVRPLESSYEDFRQTEGNLSWEEEIELLGASVVRCLGNAAQSIQQALDAMPDRYHRMAVATREFGAGDAFELELSQ